MAPNNQRTTTIALATYAAAVSLAALLYCWRESRLYVVAAIGSASAGAGSDAADANAAPAPPKLHRLRNESDAFDPHATHALWTQYQPLLPPLLAFWLWSRAVSRYARRGFPYGLCYPREDRAALPGAPAVAAAAARASALAATAFALSVALLALSKGQGLLDALALYAVPIAMYTTFLLWLLWPASSSSSSSSAAVPSPRLLLRRTLARALLPGALAPVGWADFYLADCLTSLSKSFLDAERAVCASLGAGPLRLRPQHLAASRGACGASSPPALLALCLPFFLRLCQCLSVAFGGRGGAGGGGGTGGGEEEEEGDDERESGGGANANANANANDSQQQQQQQQRRRQQQQQLANACKYAAATAAATLTQLEHEHHVHAEPFPWRRLWIAASLLSALYSFLWDCEMDWGLEWWFAWLGKERRRWGRAWRRRGRGWGRWAPLPPLASAPPLLPRLPAAKAAAAAGAAAVGSKSGGAGAGGHHHHHHHDHSPGLNFPLLLATNALLRMSWAHRLVGDLEAHALVQLSVALLEVVRRHRWGHARHAHELAADAKRARYQSRRGRFQGGGVEEEEADDDKGRSGSGSGSGSDDGGGVSDGDPEAGAAASLLVPESHHRRGTATG